MLSLSLTRLSRADRRRRPWSSRWRSSRTTCSCCGGRRRWQYRRVRAGERRDGRRYQEPGLGAADPRQDQGADAQAGHDDRQHPYARRSRQRQRRLPGQRGHRDAREHEDAHGGDEDLLRPQGTAGQRVQGRATVRGCPSARSRTACRIGSGSDQIDLYYFGRGHTDGDAWVVFPSLGRCTPAISSRGRTCRFSTPTTAEAASRFGDTLQKAHDGIKNVDTIITGHSAQATWADLAEYASFNGDFLNDVRTAKTGWQDRRRRRGRLEDSGQVRGLYGTPARSFERQPSGRVRRAEIVSKTIWRNALTVPPAAPA